MLCYVVLCLFWFVRGTGYGIMLHLLPKIFVFFPFLFSSPLQHSHFLHSRPPLTSPTSLDLKSPCLIYSLIHFQSRTLFSSYFPPKSLVMQCLSSFGLFANASYWVLNTSVNNS
ncbi:hypothetical protein B0J11DRAFT_28509 [Dendryphion nanum]|uniref:Uncharacterized protein n=1 Tax=Dendryphion nanum TaxID=256645 RepID=A0A9P9EKW8_9PLEO|nr:hypothetical protein B0J11DRAFT_28509 [Dendryphion nanum]